MSVLDKQGPTDPHHNRGEITTLIFLKKNLLIFLIKIYIHTFGKGERGRHRIIFFKEKINYSMDKLGTHFDTEAMVFLRFWRFVWLKLGLITPCTQGRRDWSVDVSPETKLSEK